MTPWLSAFKIAIFAFFAFFVLLCARFALVCVICSSKCSKWHFGGPYFKNEIYEPQTTLLGKFTNLWRPIPVTCDLQLTEKIAVIRDELR